MDNQKREDSIKEVDQEMFIRLDERIGMYILLMSNRTQGLIKLEEDRNKIEVLLIN